MTPNLKKWRDSATLLLVAKQIFQSAKQNDFNNYRILTMKRSTRSSFMPDTHVFPGGTLDKSDCSQEWLKLYKKFGVNDSAFDHFRKIKYFCPILDDKNDGYIPRFISLRICAIREAFEECGVLLCKNPTNEQNDRPWATYFGGLNIDDWQKRVHNDPSKFIELCDTFQIYPDIWALYQWSNWLTPAGMPKRFDTIFFIAATQNIPPTTAEKKEVQHIEWQSPKILLEKNKSNEIFLPPPQYYELSRLMNFKTIEELMEFAQERSKHGSERFLPYRLATDKFEVTLLPGDDLYPGEEESNTPNEDIMEEIPTCEVMHRVVHPNPFKNEIILSNYNPYLKHVVPVINFNNSKL